MCGLDFLHSQKPKILHRDIKPKNVFVVHRNGWQVKLADFGISRSLDEDESTLLTGPAGTRCWKAKEVIECRPGEPVRYKPSTDIQPAGMVIFFILTKGKHPYALDEKYHKVESRIADNEPDLSAVDDPVACDMLTNMLAADPTERPSAMELLRHPFFWDEDKRYQFLASVGNQPEVANSHDAAHVNSHVRVFIEATTVDIIPKGDWKDVATKLNQLGKRFQKDFNKQLFTESICKLLRTMRNIQDHYDEQSPGAKADLGNTCYPYGFFNSELPHLFIRTYSVIKQSTGKPDDWTEREQLKGYFSHPS